MNETELFELVRKGDKKAKEKIVSDNMGLVYSVAKRYIGRGYELEDLKQIGCIGLLKAVERFDLSFEVKFSTYAIPLIQGEIKRFLRDNGMIKVSRIIKQNGYRIGLAKEKLLTEFGREPTINELAQETGIEVNDIILAQEANREIESLQQVIYGKDGSEMYLSDKIIDDGCELDAENLMNRLLIQQAMHGLTERETKIIRLRYFEDRTQMEVAATLGISQVQVSRLEKRILKNMKENLDMKSN